MYALFQNLLEPVVLCKLYWKRLQVSQIELLT